MPFDPDMQCLYQVAGGQMGHFTAAQARACGFSTSLIAYHRGTGRFIRIHRGVYRLRDFPSSPREEVMAAWLAVGKDRAVVSHESALELLELSDVIPNSIHLTVHRSIRNLPKLPGVTILTKSRPIMREDTRSVDGIRVTSPVRSILDAAVWGTSPDQVQHAVWDALQQGTATPIELLRAASVRTRCVNDLVRGSVKLAA